MAVALTAYFRRVIATDASEQQIVGAVFHPQIEYRIAGAENSGIDNQSIDLATVAQALHWLDIEKFRSELVRTLKPGGIVAAWCYGPSAIPDHGRAQHLLQFFYTETVARYWPAERNHVENGYSKLELGLNLLQTPQLRIKVEMAVSELCGYISTWSAVRSYYRANQSNPVTQLEEKFQAVIDVDKPLIVEWLLTTIAGTLESRL